MRPSDAPIEGRPPQDVEVRRPPRVLEVRRQGRVPYGAALELQADLVSRRRDGTIPDQLLLLEHAHVITEGSATRAEHVLVGPERLAEMGVERFETGRGGDVTYHGPGQLVGYPILSLEGERRDLHRYLRDLEDLLIRVLGGFGIQGERAPGFTGVWTDHGKVAAIGVRVSSGWITSHGFALNVSTDLAFFETIVPCGLDDRRVASMESILGHPVAMEGVMDRVTSEFGALFGREVVEASPFGIP